MVIIETVLGNINDREWAKRLSAASIDILELDQWEAQKNRFRKKTAKGTELAVALDRGTVMRDGDILVWEPSKAIGIASIWTAWHISHPRSPCAPAWNWDTRSATSTGPR